MQQADAMSSNHVTEKLVGNLEREHTMGVFEILAVLFMVFIFVALIGTFTYVLTTNRKLMEAHVCLLQGSNIASSRNVSNLRRTGDPRYKLAVVNWSL